MKSRTKITLASSITLLTAGAVVLAAPLAASAHVGVTASDTAAGSYTVLTFAVPHGCEGSPTTSVTFEIPESISSVTPTVNPNWTIDKAVTGDKVDSVTYTALTPLADGLRDTMSLSLQLPEDSAGTTLNFPVLQNCEVGVTEWTQIAADGENAHDLDHPAPSIAVTAVADEQAGHGASHNDTDAATEANTDAAAASTTAAQPDVLARGLGAAGVTLGAVAVVLLVILLLKRNPTPTAPSSSGSTQSNSTKENS